MPAAPSSPLSEPEPPAPASSPVDSAAPAPAPGPSSLRERFSAATPVLCLAAPFLAVAWLWRALLLVGRAQGQLVSVDLRGFVVDLWLALLLALGLSGRRVLAGVAAALWVFVHYAVFQHVDVLGVLPNVQHTGFLGDATFFEGSVKGVRFLPLCVLSLAACAVFAVRQAAKSKGARRAEVGGAFLALGLGLVLVPLQPGYARWRQTNALATLPRDLFAADPLVEVKDDPELQAAVAAVFSADLSGVPRARAPGAKRAQNVLLLVLERLSAGYIRQGQRAQGIDYSLRLPVLERLADENLFFPNFFSHQAQSNRGLYSLLAGELPHLRTQTSKMTEVTSGTRAREAFLPALLRDRGYRTVFLEATPLHFMGMGQFMRQAGFDDAQDSSHVVRPRARGGWGVDDGSLLDHTARVVEKLEAGDKPWFVTVFSSGTHHPYTIPDKRFRAGQPDFERSFHYLDQVLGEFLAELRRQGVLEDTLVLITCDESAGLPSSYEKPLERLDKNWGFLLAMTPEGWKASDPAPCGQADVALSILDYLGLDEEACRLGFSGRSAFRTYAEPRDLYLGNTYTRQLAVYSKQGTLAVFDESLNLVASRAYDPLALLRLGEARPEPPGLRDRLIGVLSRGNAPRATEVSYAFAGTERYLEARGYELLVSGQWFETPPESVLELELDLVLDPQPGQAVFLWCKLNDRSGNRTLYETSSGPFLRGGRRRLRYRFHSAEARNRVEVRLGIDQGPGKTKIEVRRATLKVVPRASLPAQPEGSVQVELDEQSPAPQGPFVLPLRGRNLHRGPQRPSPGRLVERTLEHGALVFESRELPVARGLEFVLRGALEGPDAAQQDQGTFRLELAEASTRAPLRRGHPFEARLPAPGGKVKARVIYEGPPCTLRFSQLSLELRRP